MRVRNRRWICSMCNNRRVSATNSLAHRFLKLAAEWDQRRNGKLTPAMVTAGSSKTVWWRCAAGTDHAWQRAVDLRVRYPLCPFCAGRRVSVTNSLAALFPKIARDWHRMRNGRATPAGVTAHADQAAWWRCPLGHEWRARIRDRTIRGDSCPLCARAVLRGRASLKAPSRDFDG